MKWMMIFQDQFDMVTYISDENESRSVMPYKKFIQFISLYLKVGIEEFFTTLNRFCTIFIDCKTGIWKEVPVVKEEVDFDTLYQMNKIPDKEDKLLNSDYLKKLKKEVYSYRKLK